MVIWFNIGEMLRVQKSTQRNIEGPKVYLKSSGWDHIQARWGQSFGTVHVDDLFCMSIDFPRPQRPRSEGQRTWKVSSLCQWYIIVHVSIVHCLNVHYLIVPFSIRPFVHCPILSNCPIVYKTPMRNFCAAPWHLCHWEGGSPRVRLTSSDRNIHIKTIRACVCVPQDINCASENWSMCQSSQNIYSYMEYLLALVEMDWEIPGCIFVWKLLYSAKDPGSGFVRHRWCAIQNRKFTTKNDKEGDAGGYIAALLWCTKSFGRTHLMNFRQKNDTHLAKFGPFP